METGILRWFTRDPFFGGALLGSYHGDDRPTHYTLNPTKLRAGTEKGFFLGPSLIDSSFQALMALADPAVGIGSLKIPLSIKRP